MTVGVPPFKAVVDTAPEITDSAGSETELDRQQMFAFGENNINRELGMMLRAECALRGIDWPNLLTAAVRRSVSPSQLH